MKRLAVLGIALLAPIAGDAQDTANPAASAYRVLLSEANDRLVAMSVQVQALAARVKALEDEKARATAVPETPPGDK